VTYRETVVRTWDDNVLFSALVELTYSCNLDCFFCYNDLDLVGKRMRLSDYQRFFEDLSGLGCLYLTLTGGEPLAHPDFFAIGNRAKELRFVVRVKSNGHALCGELLSRLMGEVDPFIVEISLHGATPETHDRQTRVAGSFSRLMSNLDEMRARGLRVKLNSTLTRWNEDEVEGMFAIAERFEVPLVIDPEVTPRDNGDRTPLEITASWQGLKRLYSRGGDDEIQREGDREPIPADSTKHCGAGSSAVAVDPFGNVYPCVQWRRPVGNLHEASIREIWYGNRSLETIRHLNRKVKNSVFAPGFCPGVAEMLTGSPLKVPGSVSRRAELVTIRTQ
jgi:MoaA/NifB/PqqE/SkfB family radical SAM enzyme